MMPPCQRLVDLHGAEQGEREQKILWRAGQDLQAEQEHEADTPPGRVSFAQAFPGAEYPGGPCGALKMWRHTHRRNEVATEREAQAPRRGRGGGQGTTSKPDPHAAQCDHVMS